MSVMTTVRQSLGRFAAAPWMWVGFGLVAAIVASLLPVLGGMILLPNILRECQRSVDQGAPLLFLFWAHNWIQRRDEAYALATRRDIPLRLES